MTVYEQMLRKIPQVDYMTMMINWKSRAAFQCMQMNGSGVSAPGDDTEFISTNYHTLYMVSIDVIGIIVRLVFP